MITINDQLFITKEVNSITVAYFKKVVFRKLLIAFCFEPQSNNGTITDLFKSINFYGFSMPYEIELALSEFLWSFKRKLEKEELIAIYFWVLNQKYQNYLEDFECDDDTFSERGFGRSLAYKVYEPKHSNLEHDVIEELQIFLYNFASELDLSIIDECTNKETTAMIDLYCSSPNNSIPIF